MFSSTNFIAVCLSVMLGQRNVGSFADALPDHRPVTRDVTFSWGAIGDSWASGVTYDVLGRTDYDSNKDQCLRINHAYSVQVSQDSSWVPLSSTGQITQNFQFAACSGAQLVNMRAVPFQGYIQMDAVGDSPAFVTMQAGGNNAGFASVADKCLFHTEPGTDYQGDYPADGECSRALQNSQNYINTPAQNANNGESLELDVRNTVEDILGKAPVMGNDLFKHLYLIGYAHFFNIDDDATWCNDASFGLGLFGRPKLNLELRRALNDLVEGLNRVLQSVAAGVNDPRVGYIDTTAGFNGARFCEPNHSLYDQYFGTNVKLWNLSPEGVIFYSNGTYSVPRDPTQAEFDKWYATGMFTDNPTEVINATVVTQSPSTCAAPCQGSFPGVALRPFHPKQGGHAAMAQAIISRLKSDFGETS